MFGCQILEKHDVFLRRHQHSQTLFTLKLTWFMVSPVTPRGSESCGDAGMKAAGQTCDRVLNPGEWTHKSGWGGVEEVKKIVFMNKDSDVQPFQTCDGSCTISFLSEDLFGNRCSFFGWGLAPVPLQCLTHRNCNFCLPWQLQRSVMGLCQTRVMRNAAESTCRELDEYQHLLCFLPKSRHMAEAALTKQLLSFPLPLQGSSPPRLNMRAFLLWPNPLEFPLTGPEASVQCLESACDLIRDRQRDHGPSETRIWLTGSGLLCTTVDAGL